MPRNRLLLVCLLIVCLLVGCGGYEEISPRAYQYAQALYSICNRQDDAKLMDFVKQLDTAIEQGQLTSQEATWLNEIVMKSKAGEWSSATQEARQLMEDQIRRP